MIEKPKTDPASNEADHFGSIIYLGAQEYLWTNERLYQVAIGNLGPMDSGTFNQFTDRAKTTASSHGVKNPKLIIDIELIEANILGTTSTPYPITASEWDLFVSDARTMARYMPNVYVVDGDKFTAPI